MQVSATALSAREIKSVAKLADATVPITVLRDAQLASTDPLLIFGKASIRRGTADARLAAVRLGLGVD